MDSRSYMTCGLKIDTSSEGWHKCMTKMLKKIQGASYEVDAEGGMAYVSGKVNPTKLIRRLAQAGKQAELCWVRTGDQCTYGNGYYEDQRYVPNNSSSYMGTAGPYNMNGNYGYGGYYPSYNHYETPRSHYYPLAPYSYYY